MPKFRKRPVVIEARQVPDGIPPDTSAADLLELDIVVWSGCVPERRWLSEDDPTGQFTGCMLINTLEGMMRADPGDWIIKGVANEFYPCKPDIFEKIYEAVEA